MKKYVYISLFALVSALTACSSLDESGVADTVVPADGRTIRMHTTIGDYTRMEVPSDNKTEWEEGDAIFLLVDNGDGEKGIKAVYDGSEWSFGEWYKDGGMPVFNTAGGKVSFAMYGDNLDLSTMRPSNLNPSKTALQTLTSYTRGKVGDLLFTATGRYTVDQHGVVDIFLDLARPMAKIHISGAYLGAMQIRNQIEGIMPGGVDNAGGTNANYNKSRSMTLQQIIRYQPSSQTFRDASSGNSLGGTANMVYEVWPDDPQIVDAVYYGNMEPDNNGDITIVMCSNARTYPGIESNANLGKNGQLAYWRKFPGKTIHPGDNIYIYGPMSEEEGHLWTSQNIKGEMDFTTTEVRFNLNQQIDLKQFCKWKTPAPTGRTLTFTIGDPTVVSISEDGTTLTAIGTGITDITATTADEYSSTITVYVE